MNRWCRFILLLESLFALSASAGTLSVSFNSVPAGSVVNLTTNGPLDWVHWGLFTETSIDRKGGVTPQISDFTTVDPSNGYTFVYQYADNYNGYSWTDGDPHMAVTNTTTGVWAYASGPGGVVLTGSGFRFTVPASTNTQILRVYVGTYAARGKFSASLSDNSAPAFTSSINNSVYNSGNGPGAVYALTFAANSATQFLTITYTLETLAPMHTFDGNVTLQAAALTAPGANNIPFVTLTSPADDASVVTPTNITLNAIATDTDGFISLVEFFSGTNKIATVTNAPYSFTWTNPPPGKYSITARATDDVGAVGQSVPITLFVASTNGSLAGSRANPPTSLNLTSEGTSDWSHWGLFTALDWNHKASGASQISNFTRIGTNTVTRFTDDRTAFSWTDGTPVTSIANTNVGVYLNGRTNGFEFTAPADTNMRTLRVYAGLYGAQGNFQAWLSDFSGRAFTDTTLSNVFGNSYAVYTLNYAAASAGQQLHVRWTVQNLFDVDYGNVTLAAATLQGPAAASPVHLLNPKLIGNTFVFSFASESSHNYAAQVTPSLSPVAWQTFTNISGTGGNIFVTNIIGSASQRFYQVLTQ